MDATIRERILLHLDRFKMINEDEVYNLPFDLTQDGIASSVGISRAHSSLELKKLRQAGKVKENQVHVIGSGIRRKVYYLEPEGKAEAEHLKKKFEDAGIPIETMLDMRRCDPELMWDKLSPYDRAALGLVCVIRVPVNKKSLPVTESGVIPSAHDGTVTLSAEVKKNYLNAVDAESVREWNSAAADWWMDNGADAQERLYHLSAAGRITEARKMLIKKSEEFLENFNDDLLEIVKTIPEPAEGAEALLSIKSKIAVACGDAGYAERCARELEKFGPSEPEMIRAEIKLVRKDAEGALSDARKIYSEKGTARSAMLIGRALYTLRRYGEADKALSDAVGRFTESGDVSRFDEILLMRAGIAYAGGDRDGCLGYLSKALNSSHNEFRKENMDRLYKLIKNGKTAVFEL